MKENGYIGIISAMDIEVAALLSRAEIERVDTIGGVKYHVGTLGGKKVVITRSGLGKVYAASGAAVMLTSYPVSSVLFTGLGGGVGKQTRVLDVVVATELVQHDYGFRHNDRFEWAPDLNGIDTGTLGYSFCDPRMVESAYRAAAEVIGAEHVFRGLVATGDQFVMSEDQVDWLSEYFGAMACEMEGASVAAVCDRYGVPFVVIRCMSDRADGLAHESIDNMGERAAAQSARIVMKMLESARGEAEEETAEAPAVSWTDKLFDDTRVHAVAIRPADGAAAGAEYRAEVEIDGEVFRDVSVTKEESAPQASGTAGAGDGPCGFRIDFGKYREGQTYHGLDRLRLDSLGADPSGMKEALRLRLFSAAGVQAPLSGYAELNPAGCTWPWKAPEKGSCGGPSAGRACSTARTRAARISATAAKTGSATRRSQAARKRPPRCGTTAACSRRCARCPRERISKRIMIWTRSSASSRRTVSCGTMPAPGRRPAASSCMKTKAAWACTPPRRTARPSAGPTRPRTARRRRRTPCGS